MKELPPLAGWPTQTAFVRSPKGLVKKRHAQHSKRKHSARKMRKEE